MTGWASTLVMKPDEAWTTGTLKVTQVPLRYEMVSHASVSRPTRLLDARFVGRKQLPTTVLGLLVHIAEHTQRHLGQAITIAKVVRDLD